METGQTDAGSGLIPKEVAQTAIDLLGSCERLSSGPSSADAAKGRIDLCSPILNPDAKTSLAMQGESIYSGRHSRRGARRPSCVPRRIRGSLAYCDHLWSHVVMKEIGIAELKSKLSEFLRVV